MWLLLLLLPPLLVGAAAAAATAAGTAAAAAFSCLVAWDRCADGCFSSEVLQCSLRLQAVGGRPWEASFRHGLQKQSAACMSAQEQGLHASASA